MDLLCPEPRPWPWPYISLIVANWFTGSYQGGNAVANLYVHSQLVDNLSQRVSPQICGLQATCYDSVKLWVFR